MSATQPITQSPIRVGDPQKKGGSPEDARRNGDDMLNVAQLHPPMNTGASTDDGIHEGFYVLTAAQAGKILREHRHPKQNRDGKLVDGEIKLFDLAENHIASLADLMRRGAWRARGQIAFARVNGRLILIDGYHRLHAQVRVGVPLEWGVTIHDTDDAGSEALFWTFDTVQRKRTAQQILNVIDASSRLGVTKDMATACWKAMPLIASRFSTAKMDRDTLEFRLPDKRADMLVRYAEQAVAFDAAIAEAPKSIKKKLMVAGRAAVALVTFKHQPEMAKLFWEGIARNDGLRRGDPRHTLILDMMERNANAGAQHQSFSTTAHAWNTFVANKQVTFIRVGDRPFVKIAGTPFDGSGK